MPYCTFRLKGQDEYLRRTGIVRDGKVHEVVGGDQLIDLIRSSQRGESRGPTGDGIELSDVILSAPLTPPGKIVAAIVNTKGMLGGTDVTLDHPRLDMKAASTVIGNGEEILAPASGVRPEVELGVIIGRRIRDASQDEAQDSFFGYTIVNDVTAPADSKADAYDAYRRDKGTGEVTKTKLRGPLFRSKNHDTFCPMGPWVVTPKEIGEPNSLRMTTKFDDTLIQEGNTKEYLFSPAEIASYVSRFLTLEAGDVISCGSVGWKKEVIGLMDPTEYVLPRGGGTLELEIERIGVLRNRVRELTASPGEPASMMTDPSQDRQR